MDVIFSKMKKLGKLGICAIAVVVLLVILLAIFSPKGGTAYNVKTSLSEIVQTADMFTAEYTYNSVVGVKIDPNADNTENNIKYYVSYKGSVKSGFDFKKIEVRENGDNIIIHLPEVTIREINVDRDLEFIFTKNKYDTEETWMEAYEACETDLKQKSLENVTLRETAINNAKETLKALLKPIEKQLKDGETMEIVYLNENEQEEKWWKRQ